MDYQNRVGSKKGGGGIASDSQANLARRKQVDDLLRQGVEVPYTFEEDTQSEIDPEVNEQLTNKGSNKNPYIYKNHSGKLVCKLCNTMHMSWSSVERHLSGKKHGLNVLRRSKLEKLNGRQGQHNKVDTERSQFEIDVTKERESIKDNGIIPPCQVVRIKDDKTNLEGICIRVDYNITSDKGKDVDETVLEENKIEYPPFARIVLGLELTSDEEKDKKYIVVANPPFSNRVIEIPNREIIFQTGNKIGNSIDDFNSKCTYWSQDLGYFFIQLYFKDDELQGKDDNEEGTDMQH
ncbi:hypothetical protein C6P45_002851 [Maudiozyma exigua]|uniref:U1-type domain-containing protein n=1 Tax=Maudiozyma exigua TaxID=34358 RepID=A0A9P6WEG2_MAUEX|nr:hypothetical protein C6P45_002851 [Kazachstania exigua]